jgi:hypothetical protein
MWGWTEKKVTIPPNRETELVKIWDAVDIYNRGLSCWRSCDSIYMSRRSTLRQFKLMTNLGNCFPLDVRGVTHFYGHGKCPSDGMILLHDGACRTQQSWLETWCRISVEKRWTITHSLPAISVSFQPWRSICQEIVSPVIKSSYVLPSAGWRNTDVRSMGPEWTNLYHAVTSVLTSKETTLKNNVPVTPSLCFVTFLY